MDMKELEKYITEQRRELHRIPETAYEEYETRDHLIAALREMGFDPEVFAGTGVSAVINGGTAGRTIALISDTDGLAVREETGLPFASRFAGRMHACGHDGHMAMVLGAAKKLCGIRNEIAGRVKLIFYPGEETGSGSERAVADGVMNGVDAVYGAHLWSDIPSGKVCIRPGAVMASSDAFTIKVTGKGCHGAMPDTGTDPILAAAQIISALQQIVSRKLDPLDAAVVSVCRIEAGTGWNIIPDTAVMQGTIRCFDSVLRDKLRKMVGDISRDTAAAFGAGAEVSWESGSDVVVNNADCYDAAKDALADSFGRDAEYDYKGTMCGDDFAEYLKLKPGIFAMIGIADAERHTDFPQHNSRFDIDERVLLPGAELAAAYALRWLEENK
ncbi:MAG: amidohydrolase [Eubacteriaceae bacterium]|jgi:amidohydrolase|nr:amidohydrolase [Eubacteriaceae bacterium]